VALHHHDTARALLAHAQRVLLTRDAARDARVDLALGDDLRSRLGRDLAARSEALIGIALTAVELIELRRSRDTLIARGHFAQAQPLGGRLAVAERTIEDLIDVLSAPVTREQPVAQASADAPISRALMAERTAAALRALREMSAKGASNHSAMARALNARGLPAPLGGTWTGSQVAAVLQRAGLSLDGPATVREVRTRTRPRLMEASP
jgi:hypothetical protein